MDMTEAQHFHAHFQYLKNLKKDSLIIIDNFNVLPKEEPMLKELMQYDFSILITTRCKLTAFPVFEIKELDTEKELLPLFGNICPYKSEETDTIHNIIDTVHAHTLTVCLSALSMSASGISPSDLLYELKSCGTDIVSGEDVELYKDGEFSEGLMIEHLKKLLHITNLTEEQQFILCNLSLMPASGIWKNPFGKWLGLANLTDINHLIKYGFISENKECRTISLHPLIQEISEKETLPSVSGCKKLFESLHTILLAHGIDISRPNTLLLVLDHVINHIAVDDAASYLLFLQDLFPYSEKYGASELCKKVVDRIEYIMNKHNIASPCDRALLLDYKAELQLQNGQAENALKKRNRAIKIIEQDYEKSADKRNSNLLSNLYNNLSNTYLALHKEKEAAASLEKAFLIRMDHAELGLTETHDLLQQMMNLTNLLIRENHIDKAEKLLSAYETIVTEKIGTKSLDFGICKLTHGIISLNLSKPSEAEHYLLDAEQIFLKTAPQGNDYLKNTYQYLYFLYQRCGKEKLATQYKNLISIYSRSK